MPGRLRCSMPVRQVPSCRTWSACSTMLLHFTLNSSSTRRGAQSSVWTSGSSVLAMAWVPSGDYVPLWCLLDDRSCGTYLKHRIDGDKHMAGSALVVGASGIVGNNLARHPVGKGWQVHGLARRPPVDLEGVQPVAADLLDPESLRTALAALRPSDVFL